MAPPFGPWRLRRRAEDGAEEPGDEPLLPGLEEYAEFPRLLLVARLYLACARAGVAWPHALATDLWLLGVLVGADGVEHFPRSGDDAPNALDTPLPSDPDAVGPTDPALMARFVPEGAMEAMRAALMEDPRISARGSG